MTPKFTRDRFTWLAYLMLAYYAYMQATLGTLMAFLRVELDVSYTVSGLHMSAFALGMVGAGLTSDRLATRLGRGVMFWGGAAGMAASTLGVMLGRVAPLTIASAFVMGYLGTLLLGSIQASLADHHGPRRTLAFTESNVAASVLATAAPLAVGFLQGTAIGWRGALLLGAGLLAVLALTLGRAPLPPIRATSRRSGEGRALPPRVWAYWLAICLFVAIEWCMAFWGTEYLSKVVGLQPASAAAAMGLFFGAVVLGRVGGSQLARRVADETLLWGALAITLAGFPLFWLSPMAPLNLAGLFLMGLGVANLFPLTLAVAMGAAGGNTDAASARLTLAGGVAIFALPLLLGGLADRVGLVAAFAIVAALIVTAGGVLWLAGRIEEPSAASTPA
jgi:predicted MFS family arabinose efflux permease